MFSIHFAFLILIDSFPKQFLRRYSRLQMEVRFYLSTKLQICECLQYQPKSMHSLVRRICAGYKLSAYDKIDISSSNKFNFKDLKITRATSLKPLPSFDAQTLAFGLKDTDHMMTVQWNEKNGWGIPQIKPLAPLQIHPFNSSLHYAVQCFEGMKAYKDTKGKIRLFRPECNMQRLLNSSRRISLPDFDGYEFLKCIEEFVRIEERWIPAKTQFSLYLRPLHISMQNTLGVKSPHSSMLVLMGCPVGPYYPTGFKPISLSCGIDTIRSAPGGTGYYKVGGNYGPTLKQGNDVMKAGHNQVLWLYGDQIIEAGTSNIFFVFKGKNGGKPEVVTPILRDLILPGVTRDSIIRIFDDHPQYEVIQRPITIQQVLERNAKGELLECFSSGTAVIVGSVKNIEYKGTNHKIYIDEKLSAGPVTAMIRKQLLDIQEGRIHDKFGWAKVIN